MSDKTISAAEKIERGRRLKQARLLTGMTITDLTQDRFINYNTFCAWESGDDGRGIPKAPGQHTVDGESLFGMDDAWL